jgi:hypothetical protein
MTPVIGARAAWSLNQWDRMDLFLAQLPAENIDGSFMRAILSIHTENYADTAMYIEQTRKQLDTIMTSLLTESYSRAYVPFIMVQQCSELEEIVEYKLLLKQCMSENSNDIDINNSANTASNSTAANSNNNAVSETIPRSPGHPGSASNANNNSSSGDRFSPSPMGRTPSPVPPQNTTGSSSASSANLTTNATLQQRKVFLTEKWRRRINGCSSYGRAAIPFWKYLLNGRRMILSETEDIDTWLDFVSLCRNGGNRELAERVLMNSSLANVHSQLHGHHSHFRSINTDSGGGLGNSSSVIRTQGLAPASSTSATATNENIIMDRRIRFAMLKQQWAVGDRQSALIGLEALIRQTTLTNTTSSVDTSYLSCLLKLGECLKQLCCLYVF